MEDIGPSVKLNDAKGIIRREQIRAARALLGWSQSDLAKASGVSAPTIKRLESDTSPIVTRDETYDRLRAAFEGAGITFPPGYGTNSVGVYLTLPADDETVVADLNPRRFLLGGAEPTPGPAGLVSRLFLPGGTATPKFVRLFGYGPGRSFWLPEAMVRRITKGESALVVFSEFRNLGPEEISRLMQYNTNRVKPPVNNVLLTPDEIRVMKYIPLDYSFVVRRIASILDVYPDYLYQFNAVFNPPEPPSILMPLVKLMASRVNSEAAYWRETHGQRVPIWEKAWA